MELAIPTLVSTTGGSAAAGGIVGFAAKKLVKLIAVLVGMEFAFLAFLERMDLITVDWTALNEITSSTLTSIQTATIPATASLPELATSTGAIGGFGTGFYLGFRRG